MNGFGLPSPSAFVVQPYGNRCFQAELVRVIVTTPEGALVRESIVYAWDRYGVVCPSEITSNGDGWMVARKVASMLACAESPYRYALDRAPYRDLFDPVLEDALYPLRLYAQIVRDWLAFERACDERRAGLPRSG